jgi:hypothetical protein
METSVRKGFEDLTTIAGGSLRWRLGVEGWVGAGVFKGLVGVRGAFSSASSTLASLVRVREGKSQEGTCLQEGHQRPLPVHRSSLCRSSFVRFGTQ